MTDPMLPAGFEDALVEASDAERERHLERIAALEAKCDLLSASLKQADTKLAELVRRVRDFSAEYLQHNRHMLTAADLERILAEYEP